MYIVPEDPRERSKQEEMRIVRGEDLLEVDYSCEGEARLIFNAGEMNQYIRISWCKWVRKRNESKDNEREEYPDRLPRLSRRKKINDGNSTILFNYIYEEYILSV